MGGRRFGICYGCKSSRRRFYYSMLISFCVVIITGTSFTDLCTCTAASVLRDTRGSVSKIKVSPFTYRYIYIFGCCVALLCFCALIPFINYCNNNKIVTRYGRAWRNESFHCFLVRRRRRPDRFCSSRSAYLRRRRGAQMRIMFLETIVVADARYRRDMTAG